MVTAVLAVWMLWLCWRTTAGRREVPGHMVHLALLAVVVVEGYHLARGAGLSQGVNELSGEINVSLLIHVGLIALVVMLVQDLLPGVTADGWGGLLFGLAGVWGALAGLNAARAAEGQLMLAMMGWTGLAVLCRPLWRPRDGTVEIAAGHDRSRSGIWQWACILPVVGMALVLAVLCPPSVTVMMGAAGAALLLGACCLPSRRKHWAWGGLAILVSAAIQAWALGWIRHPCWAAGPFGWLGRGEQALVEVSVWGSGLLFLAGIIGWGGVLAFAVGLAACLIPAIVGGRHRRDSDPVRELLTVFAAVLAAAALLSPGGLFSPAVSLMFAVVWAVLPGTFGRRRTRRSGWWLLIPGAVLCLMAGLAGRRGLLGWTVSAYRRGDITLHIVVGGLLTLSLLWLLDRHRWGPWVAIAVAVAAGVGGEVAQRFFSTHQPETVDVLSHAAGVLSAAVLYVLCKACRWCESPDVGTDVTIEQQEY